MGERGMKMAGKKKKAKKKIALDDDKEFVAGVVKQVKRITASAGRVFTDEEIAKMVLELLGITLAELPGAAFGETDNLIVKADITWTGTVPEPSSALQFSASLLALMVLRAMRSADSVSRRRLRLC